MLGSEHYTQPLALLPARRVAEEEHRFSRATRENATHESASMGRAGTKISAPMTAFQSRSSWLQVCLVRYLNGLLVTFVYSGERGYFIASTLPCSTLFGTSIN